MIIKDSLKTIALSLIALSFIGVASAWTEPTSNPPADNTSAPLLTEPTAPQTTTETLQVNGLRNVGGTVLDGSVSIGPVEILDTVLTFSRKDATYPTIFKLGTDNALVIQNSNKDTITLKDGSVGIGTGETAPASKLEIKSTLDEILRLTRDGGTFPTIFRQGEDDALVVNNSEKDTLTMKSGNVGIGTLSPVKKFEVALTTGGDIYEKSGSTCDAGDTAIEYRADSITCDGNIYGGCSGGTACTTTGYDWQATYDASKAACTYKREAKNWLGCTSARNTTCSNSTVKCRRAITILPKFTVDDSGNTYTAGNATLNSTLNVVGQSTLSSLDVTNQSVIKGNAIVGDEVESADIVYKTKTFTSSGTLDIPATGVTKVTVSMSGGGGAGGDGSNHECKGGGGGGGAAAVVKQDVYVVAGESITVTVGGGGGDCGDKCATDGGTSSFGNYITTYGGKFGSPGSGGAGGAAGGEGGTAGSTRNGCNGGAGGSSLISGSGGAAGGSWGSNYKGGAGGAGYGGGGGGGSGYKDGGGGAPGYAFIEWYETTTPLFGASKLRVNGESLFLADKKIDDNTSNYYVSNKRYHVEASKVKADNTRNTVPLDMTVVNDLCKDEDGCSVTVGMRNWDSTGKPGAVATRGPYKFFISKTSDWWRLSNDAEAKDGNGTVNHIIDAWSCLLTDGEYISGTMTDSSVQLGLLNANRAGYTDTNMVCLLTIDD